MIVLVAFKDYRLVLEDDNDGVYISHLHFGTPQLKQNILPPKSKLSPSLIITVYCFCSCARGSNISLGMTPWIPLTISTT